MKRFTTLLNRTKSSDNTSSYDSTNAPIDSPEANAGRAIRLFCESGSTSNGGEEVLHLPVIVEAAESSPAAAAAAAQQIRKFLSREWSAKPHVQYNAIMLVRILCDNPGPTFTRNFDKGFVRTVKELLKSSKDMSTQTLVRETLDAFEVNKAHDEGLRGLLEMWRKEKGQQASLSHSGSRRTASQRQNGQQMQYQQPGPQYQNGAAGQQYQNAYGNGMNGQGAQQQPGGRTGGRHQLPAPSELASRIEEARNTAKILMQLIQSTPADEVTENELVKEFAERCQSAQKSMQNYINCNAPPPDDDTLQTLIETNEQLSLAGSRYQRALLAARRAMGANASPIPAAMQNGTGAFSSPPAPDQRQSRMPSPPLQQGYANGSHFQQPPQQQTNGYENESYQPPPGPPPGMLGSLQQRDVQYSSAFSPPPTQQQQPKIPMFSGPSDPFADPVEHDENPAPLAIEPTNYGSTNGGMPSRKAVGSLHQQQSPQSFSIDAEPAFAASRDPLDRRQTVELENAYSQPSTSAATPVSHPSPTFTHEGRRSRAESNATAYNISPQPSPQLGVPRPGPGPYHNVGVTPSYLGRQSSALNGLTMHGAHSEDDVAEIDSHSDVGRNEPSSATTQSNGGASSFAHSPVEVRTAQRGRRVDVAGTGGFRNSMIRH